MPRQNHRQSAPALIAPKPVKPCDRAVFGASNSLLKNERKARNPQQQSGCCLAAVRSLPFVRRCLAALFGLGFAARQPKGCKLPRQAAIRFFATGSIAPKPLKPCDRAVFWQAVSLALRAIFRAVFLFKSGAWAGRYPNMTMRFLPALPGALALLAALMGAPAFGQAYKCRGPDGALAYADRPCAASHEGGPVELRPNTLDTRSGSQPVRSVQAGGPPDRPAGQRPARHRQNSWSCRNAVRSLQTQPQRTDARQLEQERQAVRQACGPAASAQALARQPARESKPAAAAKRPQRHKRPRSPAP